MLDDLLDLAFSCLRFALGGKGDDVGVRSEVGTGFLAQAFTHPAAVSSACVAALSCNNILLGETTIEPLLGELLLFLLLLLQVGGRVGMDRERAFERSIYK